ncbi:Uncharacterized protein ChrSV_2495 [Chromobacterium vaccinii]|nr:Uncharacterized protein ChrSW_2495 [Chromobacterium vaccinii]QND89952.1 Uncharacterized protein ChrSV_2495 [Chromobacterium vaccinii]
MPTFSDPSTPKNPLSHACGEDIPSMHAPLSTIHDHGLLASATSLECTAYTQFA